MRETRIGRDQGHRDQAYLRGDERAHVRELDAIVRYAGDANWHALASQFPVTDERGSVMESVRDDAGLASEAEALHDQVLASHRAGYHRDVLRTCIDEACESSDCSIALIPSGTHAGWVLQPLRVIPRCRGVCPQTKRVHECSIEINVL